MYLINSLTIGSTGDYNMQLERESHCHRDCSVQRVSWLKKLLVPGRKVPWYVSTTILALIQKAMSCGLLNIGAIYKGSVTVCLSYPDIIPCASPVRCQCSTGPLNLPVASCSSEVISLLPQQSLYLELLAAARL